MTLDAGALIGLVSLVVALMRIAYRAGIANEQQREKFDRMSQQLDDQEHRNTQKNDRR